MTISPEDMRNECLRTLGARQDQVSRDRNDFATRVARDSHEVTRSAMGYVVAGFLSLGDVLALFNCSRSTWYRRVAELEAYLHGMDAFTAGAHIGALGQLADAQTTDELEAVLRESHG